MTTGRQWRIVVADDNPATLYSTSRVLRANGYEVLEAVNGADAEKLAQKNPDLFLLDINMPDMDGYEVCTILRTLPETSRVPILHLSATMIDVADKVRGLEAGADAYLTHPVEPEILLATVRAFLRAKELDEAYRASDAKYRAVFENALNGIVLIDEEGIIVDVNPAMCGCLGLARGELIGKRLCDFALEGRVGECEELLGKSRTGGAWRGRFPLRKGATDQTELEWNVAAGALPGLDLVVVTDVTAETKIEAERRKLFASEQAARKEAENANRLKDEFLATLSHELRTPLTAILGWSQVLKLGKSNDKFEEAVDSILRNSLAQGQLISDLLDISRITSGKLRLDLDQVDPADAIDDAIAAIAHAAESKGVEIEKKLQRNLPKLLADQSRLVQIVWNLLSNAVKYTPRGGRVIVAAKFDANSLFVTVTDNGAGVDPEFLPYMFDRFRQADSGTTRLQGGLGLGLSIVRKLAELHGGSVSAKSEGRNMGATFAVELPLKADLPPQTYEGDPEHRSQFVLKDGVSAGIDGVSVMLVEDNLDTRSFLEHVLRHAGATVEACSSVDDFLARYEDFDPDVVVSDIGLPDKDGYELIRAMHNRWQDRDVPVIALTAFATPDDSRKLLEAGFALHLSKPVDPSALVDTVAELYKARADRATLEPRPV